MGRMCPARARWGNRNACGPRVVVPAVEAQQMAAGYASATLAGLAKRFGYDIRTVRRTLVEAGVVIRKGRAVVGRSRRCRPHSPERCRKIQAGVKRALAAKKALAGIAVPASHQSSSSSVTNHAHTMRGET